MASVGRNGFLELNSTKLESKLIVDIFNSTQLKSIVEIFESTQLKLMIYDIFFDIKLYLMI